MQRRTTLLMVLAGLLLAGCTGSVPGVSNGPTLDDVTYPPGVTDDGVNGTALVEAHTEALEDRSFTTRTQFDQQSGDESSAGTMAASVGADRDRVSATITSADGEQSMYLTEDTQYTRLSADGETTYRVDSRTSEALSMVPVSYTNELFLSSFFEAANFTPSEVRTMNGTTVVALMANASDVEETSSTEVTAFEGTVLVDETGLIRSVDIELEGEDADGTTTEFEFSMTVTDVGETAVVEPGWIEEAEEQAGQS